MKVDEEKINKAKNCLIDNGIDEEDAGVVLQAIGYILFGMELNCE